MMRSGIVPFGTLPPAPARGAPFVTCARPHANDEAPTGALGGVSAGGGRWCRAPSAGSPVRLPQLFGSGALVHGRAALRARLLVVQPGGPRLLVRGLLGPARHRLRRLGRLGLRRVYGDWPFACVQVVPAGTLVHVDPFMVVHSPGRAIGRGGSLSPRYTAVYCGRAVYRGNLASVA